MSMASAAPFSGLSRPANSAPWPAVSAQGMTAVGGYGGRIASTGTTRRQALAWESETVATAGGLLRRAASPSAADTAWAGGRGGVGTTGARRGVARRVAGRAEGWLVITAYGAPGTAA